MSNLDNTPEDFDLSQAIVVMPKKRIRIGHTVEEYTIYQLADGRYILENHDMPYYSLENPPGPPQINYEVITNERYEKLKTSPSFSGSQEDLDEARKRNPNNTWGIDDPRVVKL